jgi:hypothetical protein
MTARGVETAIDVVIAEIADGEGRGRGAGMPLQRYGKSTDSVVVKARCSHSRHGGAKSRPPVAARQRDRAGMTDKAWTAEDFLRTDQREFGDAWRYELVDGRIVAHAAPTPAHAKIVVALSGSVYRSDDRRGWLLSQPFTAIAAQADIGCSSLSTLTRSRPNSDCSAAKGEVAQCRQLISLTVIAVPGCTVRPASGSEGRCQESIAVDCSPGAASSTRR